MSDYILYHGDCLEQMAQLPEKQIDAVICDPPYGTTTCKWDSVIPFDPMWDQLERLVKTTGAIVLFGIQPFTSALIMSNPRMFKYQLIWRKSRISHFAQAPYRFLTEHEEIVVFSKGGTSKNAASRMIFNPQGLKDCDKKGHGRGYSAHRPVKHKQPDYRQTKTNYPKSILDFQSDPAKLHPTQKPVPLMEYLVRTYTNPGDTVLDFAAGSGSTGVACMNTGRDFIGIERESKYIGLAAVRLQVAQSEENDESNVHSGTS